MAKAGRKHKPYRTTWGETIDGLYKGTGADRRWVIVATGEKYTEHDELVAVARFRRWQQENAPGDLHVPVPTVGTPEALVGAMDVEHDVVIAEDGSARLSVGIKPSALWPWLRFMLVEHPEVVARETGIPQLVHLRDMALPKDSVALSTLWKEYDAHSTSRPVSKRKYEATWDDFVAVVGVETLRDLTTERLIAYADATKRSGLAAETVANRFGRVKAVIAFGLKRGLDPAEIRAALDRAAVLVPPRARPSAEPHPISRADLHALLDKASPVEAAAILVALNCCMYASEAMALEWEDLDLGKRTLSTRRGKTNVVRTAVLWRRTVDALRALPGPRAGPIFRSNRGLAYHPNSFRKLFAELRTAAKVDPSVEFNALRDGAYTAACEAGVDINVTRILAGHSSGMADHYVQRRPAIVRPACEAVEKHYFG